MISRASLLLAALLLTFALACSSSETEPEAATPPTAAAAAGAQDEHGDHAGAKGHEAGAMHDEMAGEAAHEGMGGATAHDLASTWASLQGVRDAIAADVKSGQLGGIHEKSEGLEPLARAMLEGGPNLSAEQRARAESAVKQIPAVADKLHEAADGGDAARTSAALEQLDAVLELLSAQYPADALEGGAAHSGHGSGGGHDHAAMTSHLPGHDHSARPLAAVDAPAERTLVVKSTEFAFEPRTLEVRAGVATRIELDNREALVEHSLLVRAPGGGDLIHLHAGPKSSDAGTYRLDTPGTYDVLCTIPGHTEAGMVGKLLVVGSARQKVDSHEA